MLLWGPPYWGANFQGLVLCGQYSHNWCLKQPGARFCNLTFMSYYWESTSVQWLFLIFVYYENQSFHFLKNSFHIISCDFEEVEREVSYFILEEINYASEKCRSSQGHTEANWRWTWSYFFWLQGPESILSFLRDFREVGSSALMGLNK